jgi:deoxyguanosine kinase
MNQASPKMFKNSPQQPTTYFTIEGNIGCGKSTFLELLKQRIPELEWIEEPVTEWQSLGEHKINMLERYYTQPARWGFTFQIYAIYTRLKKMQEACQRYPDRIKISERSILADKYVFSEIMRDLEYMDKSEYEIYRSLYQSFEKMAPINDAKIIYLHCSPQKCFERTLLRKRE